MALAANLPRKRCREREICASVDTGAQSAGVTARGRASSIERSLVRRDGAEVAVGRGLHLARRVVGVYRDSIFDFIKPLVSNGSTR
jgi:hypothetical protein